jgi:predicted RNase H-like nuclease
MSTTLQSFIGIDLAWKSEKNNSGGAVIEGDQRGMALQEAPRCLPTLADVKAFIAQYAQKNTVIAIDAPLIIKNKEGQRSCETEIGRKFGKAHASAHTSNRNLYPCAGGVQLAHYLENQGYQHCPPPPKPRCRLDGKWFLEVYPHPAHVVLFKRSQIIKYKRGPVALRKQGLREFRQCIQSFLCNSDPPLQGDSILRSFLETNLEAMKGIALKHYEDKLDAVFCAYLAAYFWTWSYERNEMIGTHEDGYIINPNRTDPSKDSN